MKKIKYGIPNILNFGLFFIFIYLNFSISLWSQSKVIDSLKEAIEKTSHDTLKIDLYNRLSLEYLYIDPDSALAYIDTLKLIGENFSNDRALAAANNRRGVYYMITSNNTKAMLELIKAEKYYSNVGDTTKLAGVYNNLGANDFYIKDYNSSLYNYKKGLKILDRFQHPELYLVFVLNLSEVNLELKQLDSAVFYAEQAIDLSLRLKDKRKLATAYYHMGTARLKMQSYPEALSYLIQALTYKDIPIQYDTRARIYKVGSLVGLDRMGEAKVQLNELEEKVLNASDKTIIMQFYQIKSQFYKSSGQFEEALVYAEKYQVLNEELQNIDQVQIRENLKVKSNISQKENENKLLRHEAELNNLKIINQRNLIWSVGVFIFILLILVLVLSRMYEVNQKANIRLQTKQKVLNRDNRNLEKQNTQKNNLFSIVAHDVKSPLGAIMTSINMLKDNISDFSEQELNLLTSELSRQAESLYNLLDGALTWTKSQMEGYKFYRKNLNACTVIQSIIDVERVSISKKELTITNQIPEDFEVYADAQVIEVVMRNLINNAIKFTVPGGTIRFEASTNEKESRLSVIDNGLGISQDKIDQIFVERQRYTRKGTGDEVGNGIGLILCSEIAKAMGGGIEVKSTVGRGSNFTLVIPKCKGE
ncbi:tetratricopeptide repeat-containing sensor histidine kinase [Flavimarina sp. Hel_I_48]|uniref:ATP-binding protein n=1 Tax=Flavimarina sp. Hel_I_48 TaxID=1392488 RepID=UPI0004DFC15A|nr:tetratricopeptide repeat-containing sensor histidine kinase [Flavimarina sp. Hel_I_48]